MKHSLIVGALRKLWLYSKERYQVVKAARISPGKYQCNECKKLFPVKQIQVDHIQPIGVFVNWDTYIERLFCPPQNLQVLCKLCHLQKTKETKDKGNK